MINIIYITEKGKNLSKKIENILNYYHYSFKTYHIKGFNIEKNSNITGFIFIGAIGIVLRKYIPSIINDKLKDPFIIVINETGSQIIPLLSNHVGGGNYFAKLIGNEIKGNVAITTATDTNNKIGIDELSRIYYLQLPDRKDILKINKKILNQKVSLKLPYGWKEVKNLSYSYDIDYHSKDFVVVDNSIILKPKKIVVGVGCRKGTPSYNIYWTIKKGLYLRDIPLWRIDAIGTIDIKKDEVGLLKVISKIKKKLHIFSKEELNEIYKNREDLEKSDFVFKNIGVYGVSEGSSIATVNKLTNCGIKNVKLLLKKLKGKNTTVSIAMG